MDLPTLVIIAFLCGIILGMIVGFTLARPQSAYREHH